MSLHERWNTLRLLPLVLSASGGMANQATIFYKRLASRTSLALKWDQPYSSTMNCMVAHQNYFFTSPFCNSVYSWLTLQMWTCCLAQPPIDLAASELHTTLKKLYRLNIFYTFIIFLYFSLFLLYFVLTSTQKCLCTWQP